MAKRRRRNDVQDFLDAFNASFGAVGKVTGALADSKAADAYNEGSRQTTTEVASGDEALAAGQSAREQALAQATTDEQRAQIEQDYAPTIQALEAEKGRAAGVAHSIGVGAGFKQQDKAFTDDELQRGGMEAKMSAYRGSRAPGSQDKADALSKELRAADLASKQGVLTDMQIGREKDAEKVKLAGREIMSSGLAQSLFAGDHEGMVNEYLKIYNANDKDYGAANGNTAEARFVQAVGKMPGGAEVTIKDKDGNAVGTQFIQTADIEKRAEAALRNKLYASGVVDPAKALDEARQARKDAQATEQWERTFAAGREDAGNANTRGNRALDLQGAGVAMARETHNAEAATRANKLAAAGLLKALSTEKNEEKRADLTRQYKDLTGEMPSSNVDVDVKTNDYGNTTVIQKGKDGSAIVTPIDRNNREGKQIVIKAPGKSDDAAKMQEFNSPVSLEAAIKDGKVKKGDKVIAGGKVLVIK